MKTQKKLKTTHLISQIFENRELRQACQKMYNRLSHMGHTETAHENVHFYTSLHLTGTRPPEGLFSYSTRDTPRVGWIQLFAPNHCPAPATFRQFTRATGELDHLNSLRAHTKIQPLKRILKHVGFAQLDSHTFGVRCND